MSGLNTPYRSTSDLAKEFLQSGNPIRSPLESITAEALRNASPDDFDDIVWKLKGQVPTGSYTEAQGKAIDCVRVHFRSGRPTLMDNDLHVPGAKDDQGKSRIGLMFSGFQNAIPAVAEVTTYGAAKYTPNGWLSVPDAPNRYTDAMFRHLFARIQGQKLDCESNLRHLAHNAWNALAILELELRKELTQTNS